MSMGDRRIPISIGEIEQLVKKRKAMIRVAGDWRSRADLSLILSEGNSETKTTTCL